jgi:hypothetical protein
MTPNLSQKIRMSLLIYLLLPAICLSVPAADIRFASEPGALAIPFELDDNLIYVQVSINGSKPLSFILDTGAFNMVNLPRARELGVKLKLAGKTDGIGAEQQEVFLGTEQVSFGLAGVTLSKQRLLGISLARAEECVDEFMVDEFGKDLSSSKPQMKGARRKVDGILGAEFFHEFVVEIDYAARLIHVYDPAGYKYQGKGEKLPLEVTPQHIFVQAQVLSQGRPALPVKLLVDTGGAMAIALNKRFTDEHQLLPSAEGLATTSVCGLAGKLKEKALVAEIDAMVLGNLKIENPLVEFRRAAVDSEPDGLLGGAVLRHYKVIFDYSRGRMILEQPPRS